MREEGVRISKRIPGKHLRATLRRLGLERPGLGWYEATRHTFASQWVLGGGSIEILKEILGHHSVVVTERYTHLRPDLFADRERSTIPLALNPAAAPLRANWAEFGQREPRTASQPSDSEDKRPEWSCKPRTGNGDHACARLVRRRAHSLGNASALTTGASATLTRSRATWGQNRDTGSVRLRGEGAYGNRSAAARESTQAAPVAKPWLAR